MHPTSGWIPVSKLASYMFLYGAALMAMPAIQEQPLHAPCTSLHPPAPWPCRRPPERGEYRLQSEDGSLAIPESDATGAAAALSNGVGGAVESVLSLGRTAAQSMQPDAAEDAELTQLITPLVIGEQHLVNHIHWWRTAWLVPHARAAVLCGNPV